MNRDEQPRRRRPLLWVYLLAAFALTMLFGFSDEVLAQGQWTTNGDNISNTNSGNVGIGTNTPPFSLTIQKDYNGPTVVGAFNTADGPSAQIGLGVSRTMDYSSKYFVLGVTAPSFSVPGFGETAYLHSRGVPIKFGTQSANDIYFFTNGISNTRLTITSGGNVGIGTYSPSYKLDVAGQIRSSSGGFVFPDGTVQTTAGGGSGGGTITGVTAGAGLTGGGTSGNVTLTNADPGSAQSIFKNIANAAGATQFSAGSNNDSLRFEGSGGTSVTFDAASKKVIINSSTSGSTISATNVSTGQFGQNTGGGNYSFPASVGIGTASPVFMLDVLGSTNNPFRVRDGGGREYFSTTTRTGTYATVPVVSIAGARLIIDNNGPEGGNDTIVGRTVNSLIFSPSDTSGLPGAFMVRQVGGSSILYIDQNANGNVGIGTTNPQAKLDVQGNVSVTGDISATGNIAAKYQDVAEWVPSRQKLTAGTVVVLDTQQSNHVIASSNAYDTRVAGVVSAQPGVILGEGGANKAMIATTGRVKVKVDATRQPIQVGDLLVTSDKEGVAMKSEPVEFAGRKMHMPGTIIGKALEPLAKGHGEILVLLSLQ